MTPRQAITWAELIAALILWGLYVWGVVDEAPQNPATPGDLLWPSVPNLILLMGALAFLRGCVFVMARSPRLSAPGIGDYEGRPLLWDSHISGIMVRETIAVLMGRRKDNKSFATEAEAGHWRSARWPGLVALLIATGLTALAAGVWNGLLHRALWADRPEEVVVIVNAICVCWLVSFLVHRILFLRRSRPI